MPFQPEPQSRFVPDDLNRQLTPIDPLEQASSARMTDPTIDDALIAQGVLGLGKLGLKAALNPKATATAVVEGIKGAGKAISGLRNGGLKKALSNIKGFPESLQAPKAVFEADPVTELTHATRTKSATNIMKEGFKPELKGTGADASQEVKGFMGEGVSMAKNKEVALANVKGDLAQAETSIVKSYIPEKQVLKVTKETYPEAYENLINPDPLVSKPVAQTILEDAKTKGFKAVSFPDGETVVIDAKAIRRLSAEPVVKKAKQLEFPATKPTGITFNKTQMKSIEKESGLALPRSTPSFDKPVKEGLATKLGPTEQMVPKTEGAKAIDRATMDKMIEPISKPGENIVDILPEGAKDRITKLTTGGGKDLPPTSPFATSSEKATNVGDLGSTVRDQLQSGLKAEATAEEAANAAAKGVFAKYKIDPSSTESQAIVRYGQSQDKLLAQSELALAVGPEKASKIIAAEAELRKQFNTLRERNNEMRVANNLPPIPYKEDYFPQLHEINLLHDLGLTELTGTEKGAEVASKIMTDNARLKTSKFKHLTEMTFRHLNKQGALDVEDAITGFEKYARETERAIALQPHINELRATAKAIQEKFPNLAKEYIDRADFIAGKEVALDAAIKNVVGPESFKAFVTASNAMKGNLIEGNPSVPVSQLFVLPSIMSDLPLTSSLVGTVKAAANPEFRNFLVANSPTLRLRLAGEASRSLHQGIVRKTLSKPSEFVDSSTLLFSLAGKFTELVKKGVPEAEALAQAEQFASLTQATLSKLNTAPILRSKTSQATMPFMNQVLSQSRFVTTQMMRGKSLTGKAAAAAKFTGTGIAIAAAAQLLRGEKAKSPLDAAQYVPMGPALEQGIGGPVIGSAGRFLKAPTVEQKLIQLFRAGMLLQNKIPAGLQVSKGVEALFKEGE